MKTNTLFVLFFKCLLNSRAHALQSQLNKVSISNFVRFKLQSMSSKIERALEKRTKLSIKIRLKRTLTKQLKRTINQCENISMSKDTFFWRNVMLYTINNISLVLEIIIIKFSCILKMMCRNTVPEH